MTEQEAIILAGERDALQLEVDYLRGINFVNKEEVDWINDHIRKSNKKELIHSFLKNNEISLNEIIDVVIKSNRIIGVGLISFQEDVSKHILGRIK